MLSRFGLGLGGVTGGGGPSDIITSIFADGTDGFYFDFSKTNRLFQDLGNTPTDDAGENVYLGLEGSKWAGRTLAQQVVAQAELVAAGWSNGSLNGFDVFNAAGSGFTGSTSTAKVGGAAINSPIAMTAADLFRVEIQVNSASRAHSFAFVNGVTGASGGRSNAVTIPLTASPITVVGYVRPTADGSWYPQINNGGSFISSVDIASISVKEIPGNHGLQATTSAQPKYQTGGLARFDGLDDNLLTTLNLASAFTLLVKMKPTTGAGAQIAAGSAAAAGTQLWLGTNGSTLAANVGGTLLSAGSSVNGAVVVAGVRVDGTAIDLFSQGTVIDTDTTAGTPNTTIALRVGSYSNGGVASNFFNGDIYHALAVKKALTAAQIAAITNKWGTT